MYKTFLTERVATCKYVFLNYKCVSIEVIKCKKPKKTMTKPHPIVMQMYKYIK